MGQDEVATALVLETDTLLGRKRVPGDTTIHRRKLAQTKLYFAAELMNGAILSGMGPCMQEIHVRLQATNDQIADTVFLRATMKVLGTMIYCWQVVQLERRSEKAWSISLHTQAGMLVLLGTAVGALFMGAASSVQMLVAGCLLSGLALGWTGGAINSMVAWTWEDDVKAASFFVPIVCSAYPLGAIMTPLFVVHIIDHGGSALQAYMILSCLSLFLAAAFVCTPTPHVPFLERGQEDDPFAGGDRGAKGQKPRARLRETGLYWEQGAALCVIGLMVVGAEHTMANWISQYTIQRYHEGEKSGALVSAVLWTTLTLSRFSWIPAQTLMTAKWALSVCLFGGVLSGLLMIVGQNESSNWLGVAGVGMSLGPIFPVLICFIIQETNASPKATMLTRLLIFTCVGEMVFPFIGGFVLGSGRIWLFAPYVFVQLLMAYSATLFL